METITIADYADVDFDLVPIRIKGSSPARKGVIFISDYEDGVIDDQTCSTDVDEIWKIYTEKTKDLPDDEVDLESRDDVENALEWNSSMGLWDEKGTTFNVCDIV